jgi:ribonuclease P protein component
MLPTKNRLTTKDIARLFGRASTQKIVAYPFVYFVSPAHPLQTSTKWGIQLSTKVHKSSVKRHTVKRQFYSAIEKINITFVSVSILAVPQKVWIEEMSQVLATQDKNTIV